MVVAFSHTVAGGLVHVTPVQGSGAHAVPRQPKVQLVCAPAWQDPFTHVDAAVATPFRQLAAAHAVSNVV
jgi:hypothetical protein